MRTRDHNPAMINTEHARVLTLLRTAGERPLPLAALEHAGVRNPATVVYELESRGYLIRHVAGSQTGFRLEGLAEGVVGTVEGLIAPAPAGRHAR